MHEYLRVDYGTVDNIKLIIGNGFDLACGLNSSYGAFFDSSSSIFLGIERWINGKSEFPKDGTAWDIYFYLLSKCKDILDIYNTDWKDIESWMYKSFKTRGEVPFSFCGLGETETYEQSILDKYFIDNNQDLSNRHKCYSFLLNELIRFEERFSNFLMEQEEDPIYNENVKRMFTMDGLFRFFDNPDSRKKYLISIDTFNYTTPKYFEQLKGVKIRHVNGKIGSAIFGIDSDGIDSTDEAYIFTKIDRKITNLVNGGRESFSRTYKNIVIFGHSFSRADYSYFFPILDSFNTLKYNNYASRMIIGFSDFLPNRTDNIKNRKNLARAITKMFESYDKYVIGKNAKAVITKISNTLKDNNIYDTKIINDINNIISKYNENETRRQSSLELLTEADRIGFYKIDTTKLIKRDNN